MKVKGFKVFEWAVVLISALILTLAYTANAGAATVPQLKEYVNDYASILPEAYRHQLNERLHDFELKTTGHPQVVVVTVPNTGDDSIEDFANQTFHQNKIGHTNNNNGVLTVISMDHKMRIEVGYDLEPTLTDSKSNDILQSMKPYIRDGNYPRALDTEMSQLFPLVSAGSAENTTSVTSPSASSSTNSKGIFLMLTFLLTAIILGFIVWFLYKAFGSKNTDYQDDDTVTSVKPIVRPSSTVSTTSDYTSTYVPPASPNYKHVAPMYPTYRPRSSQYSNTSNSSNDSGSVIKSAAVGGLAGFAASELLSNKKDDYNNSSSSDSSSSWSSPSYSDSSSSSSSSDSSFSGGGGDSGGGGSTSDW